MHHIMSPKGKKIIEEVKNDLMKVSVNPPLKLNQERDPIPASSGKSNGGFGHFGSTLRGISVNQRKSSNPSVSVRHEVWTTHLRREMGINQESNITTASSSGT
jgi:hypothetical protein